MSGSWLHGPGRSAGLAHERYATASEENTLEEVALPAETFVSGENVLAVVVKQTGRTSPDLSFDLALDLTLAGPL